MKQPGAEKKTDRAGVPAGNRRKYDRKMKRRKALRYLKRAFLVALLLLFIAAAAVYCIYFRPIYNEARESTFTILSNMDDGTFRRQSNTLIYGADGELLTKIGFENYKYVDISKISDYIVNGYIDVEDKHFASHGGIDIKRTAYATYLYLRNRITKNESQVQGGSTITQQVVKNNFLSQERSVKRKFLEIMIAMELEKEKSKAQIMEYYCNTNYYGNGCYGVEGASQYYFGKSAADVTLAEAAMLVGTSNSPNTYNPAVNYTLAMNKKRMVLDEMLKEGDITDDEYRAALDEEPEIVRKTAHSDNENYAVTFAIHDAALKVMEHNGFEFMYTFDSEADYKAYRAYYEKAYAEADSIVRSGGYSIYTSLDMDMQKMVFGAINDSLAQETEKQDDGRFDLQSAAVVIDNESGYIVAAVGGREEHEYYNRTFNSERQPGSSIKPLLVYGPACDNGVVTPGTVYSDEKVDVNGYSPKNFDDTYRGEMTVREALVRSVNTIAVQLLEETSPQICFDYLAEMQFSTLTYGDLYNAAAALGGLTRGVTVEDMARGYATLCNNGALRDNTCIKKIETEAGETIYEHDGGDIKEVYSRETSFMVTDMMEGLFHEDYSGARSAASDTQVYAGKSGTTDNNRDAWFCGYSGYYTTAVWVGCDSPKSMNGISGSAYPLTIWKTVMDKLHNGRGKKEFTPPETVVLQNGKGETKKAVYTTDVYTSRPDGWDYCPTTISEDLSLHRTEREEKAAQRRAEKAVADFEEFQIKSAEDAESLESRYYDIKLLIDNVSDAKKHAELQERAAYKYSLLAGEVVSAWQEAVSQKRKSEQKQRDIENREAAAVSKEAAGDEIKTSRISVVRKYIDFLNGCTMYTDDVEDAISDAFDALSECMAYDEFTDLRVELDAAIENARSQITEDEYNKQLSEQEEEELSVESRLRALEREMAKAE